MAERSLSMESTHWSTTSLVSDPMCGSRELRSARTDFSLASGREIELVYEAMSRLEASHNVRLRAVGTMVRRQASLWAG